MTNKKINLSLTDSQWRIIYEVLNTQLNWQEGGCLIDDNGNVDKKVVDEVKKILYEIRNRNYKNGKI